MSLKKGFRDAHWIEMNNRRENRLHATSDTSVCPRLADSQRTLSVNG